MHSNENTAEMLVDCKRELSERLEAAMIESETEMYPMSTNSNEGDLRDRSEYNNDDSSEETSNRMRSTTTTTSQYATFVADSTYLSYEDIGRAAWGQKGVIATNFVVLTSQLGFCCAYCLFMAENLASIFLELGFFSRSQSTDGSSDSLSGSGSASASASGSGSESGNMELERNFTMMEMLITVGLLAPLMIVLSWLRDSRQLVHTSAFGLALLIPALGVVAYYGASLPSKV